MPPKLIAINHICIVVRNSESAERFYQGILGLKRHDTVQSWFHLTECSLLHLVEIPEATQDDSMYHQIQHVALQVEDLDQVRRHLIGNSLEPFQMDFNGNVQMVTSYEVPLDFGIGTLFVEDPDGNLLEFLQLGQGIFREA